MSERNARMASIVPQESLEKKHFLIIGTGAIGRQVVLQLAAMGCLNITMYDHDEVEEVNLGVQGFLEHDLGSKKVAACEALMEQINQSSNTNFQPCPKKFDRSEVGIDEIQPDVVFCCVDTMEARKFIWKSFKDTANVFLDGRMAAMQLHVLTHIPLFDQKVYDDTLFDDSEAYQGSCTSKSTLFTANVAAGLMVSQMVNAWKQPPETLAPQIVLNLQTMDMSYETASSGDDERSSDNQESEEVGGTESRFLHGTLQTDVPGHQALDSEENNHSSEAGVREGDHDGEGLPDDIGRNEEKEEELEPLSTQAG